MAQQDPVFQFLNTMPQMLMNVYSQRQREKQAIRDYLNKLNLEIARYGGDIIDVPEGLSAKELERFVPQATREIGETFEEQRAREEAEKQRARQEANQRYFTSLQLQNIGAGGDIVPSPTDYSFESVQETVPQFYQQVHAAREEAEGQRNLEGVINNIESLRRSLIGSGVPVGEIPEFDSIEKAREYELMLQNKLSGEVASDEQYQKNAQELSYTGALLSGIQKQLADIEKNRLPGKDLSPEIADKKTLLERQYGNLWNRYLQLLPKETREALAPPEIKIAPNPTPPPGTEPPPPGGGKKIPEEQREYFKKGEAGFGEAIREYEKFDPLRKWWNDFLKYGRGNMSSGGYGRTY